LQSILKTGEEEKPKQEEEEEFNSPKT